MNWLDRIHGNYVHDRRIRVLAERLAPNLPRRGRVLDLGSGDGRLARLINDRRPDLSIVGIDVLVRPDAQIPTTAFDGKNIPFPPGSFDAVLLVDVLHHADDPLELLRSAVRVSRRTVLIKDHLRDGWLAGPTLRFMDRVGNARHGVTLPYNYWKQAQWRSAWEQLNLHVAQWEPRLGLYPWPANLVFERSLHFVARLEKRD